MKQREDIDWSEGPFVEAKIGVQGGVPVLRGTRLPVDAVMDNFDYGVTAGEIAEQFEMPIWQIEAVIVYAQMHRSANPVR